MKFAFFILFIFSINKSAYAADNTKFENCDIATFGVGIVNAGNTAPVASIVTGQAANFKFSIANFGSDPGCSIPANSVTAIFDFPTLAGGVRPYKYDGPVSFVSGYFTWTYNSVADVLTGTNSIAIPNGTGDANILVRVKGFATGTGSSNLNITQGMGVSDNAGNNYGGAQLIITAATVNTVCPASVFSLLSTPGTSYQWQLDAGNGFINISNDAIYSGVTTNTLTLTNAPTSWYGYLYQCIVTNGPSSSHTVPVILKFSLSWLGAADNTWENPLNWSCAAIPDAYTDVIINTGSTPYPEVNSNAVCRSLTTQLNSTIVVKPGFKLDIKGQD